MPTPLEQLHTNTETIRKRATDRLQNYNDTARSGVTQNDLRHSHQEIGEHLQNLQTAIKESASNAALNDIRAAAEKTVNGLNELRENINKTMEAPPRNDIERLARRSGILGGLQTIGDFMAPIGNGIVHAYHVFHDYILEPLLRPLRSAGHATRTGLANFLAPVLPASVITMIRGASATPASEAENKLRTQQQAQLQILKDRLDIAGFSLTEVPTDLNAAGVTDAVMAQVRQLLILTRPVDTNATDALQRSFLTRMEALAKALADPAAPNNTRTLTQVLTIARTLPALTAPAPTPAPVPPPASAPTPVPATPATPLIP